MVIIYHMHVDGKISKVMTNKVPWIYKTLPPQSTIIILERGDKPIPHVIHDLQLTSPSGSRGVTYNINSSGSEYMVLPSSDISTNTQIDYSEVFAENVEINQDNPDEYLKTNIYSNFTYY